MQSEHQQQPWLHGTPRACSPRTAGTQQGCRHSLEPSTKADRSVCLSLPPPLVLRAAAQAGDIRGTLRPFIPAGAQQKGERLPEPNALAPAPPTPPSCLGALHIRGSAGGPGGEGPPGRWQRALRSAQLWAPRGLFLPLLPLKEAHSTARLGLQTTWSKGARQGFCGEIHETAASQLQPSGRRGLPADVTAGQSSTTWPGKV